MAFDNGPLSFCVYRLDEDIPENILELFAEHAALPLNQVKDETSNGWTARHLLEREFTEESCLLDDFIQVHFRSSELKVSAPILKARCSEIEFEVMREEYGTSGTLRKGVEKTQPQTTESSSTDGWRNISFEEYANARGLEIRRNGVVVNDPYSDPWAAF